MRVIYVLNGFPKHSETFIIDEICGLITRGVEVDVVALWPGGGCLTPRQQELLNGRVSYAVSHPSIRDVVLSGLVFLPHLILHRDLVPSAISLSLRARKLLFQAAILFRWLTQHQHAADVCVSHFASTGISVAMVRRCGLLANVPHVNVSHGSDLSLLPRNVGNRAFQMLFKQPSTRAVTIARVWERNLYALGAESVHVRRLGVDVERFAFKQRSLPVGQPVRLLTVGRLVEKKGYLVAIRALAMIPREIAWEYHIVGAGPLAEAITSCATNHEIADRIIMHGALSTTAVQHQMECAHIFVLASHVSTRGDCEGIPVSLMEAMSCGLPVVTTDHSGIPELVIDQETGLVAREGDAISLAEKLRLIMMERSMWAPMSERARAKVVLQFNNDKNIGTFYEFLSDTIG